MAFGADQVAAYFLCVNIYPCLVCHVKILTADYYIKTKSNEFSIAPSNLSSFGVLYVYKYCQVGSLKKPFQKFLITHSLFEEFMGENHPQND